MRVVLGALLCAPLLVSCGGDELLLPVEGEPASVAIVRGDGQAGVAGSTLPEPLVVRVADTRGRPIEGREVTFTVTQGDGSVIPAADTTDPEGLAAVTWTLGPRAGGHTADARVTGASPALSARFAATAEAGAGAKLTIVSGNGQSALAGSRLPAPLVVRILDANDNPAPGRPVTWVIGLGGGSVDPATSTTGADGTATTSWTLGPQAGTNTVTAVVSGVGSVGFAATGTAAPATRLVLNGGNGQTAPAQSRLLSPLAVKAVDANGNGVAGVSIAWAVTSGGGSLSASSTTTRPDGIAEVTWTLGATVGAQTARATAAGLEGSPVDFSATAMVGAATRLTLVTQPSATASSGTPFAQQPVVQLLDASGNDVGQAGVQVTAAIASGGGTLGGTTTRSTDGSGRAAFTDLSISGTPGPRTLIFAADGFSSATSSAIEVGPGAPSGSRSSLTALPTEFEAGAGSSTVTVTVRDAQGTPLPGVSVAIAVSGSGNSITQPAATSTSGETAGSFTSTAAETKAVSATADGVPIDQTATVTVTAPPPPPPPPPTADPGQTTATVPAGIASTPTTITVQVRDAEGNPYTAGDAAVSVSVTGANTAGPIAAADQGGGIYGASYTPINTGDDFVAITLNGSPIAGSPYTSTVVGPSASQVGVLQGAGSYALRTGAD